MNRYTLEDFYDNPELYRRLAHRERDRALGEVFAWLAGGIARLLRHVTPRIRLRPARWIARLG